MAVLVLVVLLLLGALVCAMVAAFAPPPRPQMGWVAVTLIAGAMLVPAIRVL